MIEFSDLKPCQREVYKNFEHDDSYFITLRARCPVHWRQAVTMLDRVHMSGEIYHRTKLGLIRKLCEGCKEVGSCENA